jgi:Spy/CpxP family protein refolding chaperone
MPPGRESVEQRVERLSKELDLTQEQREKIRPVLEEQMKQMRALREDSSLTQEQRREKAMAAMKETHEKVEAILNPEQREKLKQHMQQMRDQRSAEHKEAPAKQ